MDIRIWVQGMGQEQMLTNINTKILDQEYNDQEILC